MIYLTRRQLLPSVHAWGYVAGNIPRPIRDQRRPLDDNPDLPMVHLLIPPEMRDTGHSHARITWIPDCRLYRVEWTNDPTEQPTP